MDPSGAGLADCRSCLASAVACHAMAIPKTDAMGSIVIGKRRGSCFVISTVGACWKPKSSLFVPAWPGGTHRYQGHRLLQNQSGWPPHTASQANRETQPRIARNRTENWQPCSVGSSAGTCDTSRPPLNSEFVRWRSQKVAQTIAQRFHGNCSLSTRRIAAKTCALCCLLLFETP